MSGWPLGTDAPPPPPSPPRRSPTPFPPAAPPSAAPGSPGPRPRRGPPPHCRHCHRHCPLRRPRPCRPRRRSSCPAGAAVLYLRSPTRVYTSARPTRPQAGTHLCALQLLLRAVRDHHAVLVRILLGVQHLQRFPDGRPVAEPLTSTDLQPHPVRSGPKGPYFRKENGARERRPRAQHPHPGPLGAPQGTASCSGSLNTLQ